MSDAAWFKDQYGVPADIGRVVEVLGVRGVIVGHEGPHIRVRHEGSDHVGTYHPTYGVDYDPPEPPLYRDFVERRLAVLDHICRSSDHVSVSEIATFARVRRSVAHRDLCGLESLGYIAREPVRRYDARRDRWLPAYDGWYATDAGLAAHRQWYGDAGQASLETA